MTVKEFVEQSINPIRVAFKKHDDEIKELRKKIAGFETLMESKFGNDAVSLHTSFKPHDIKSPLGPEYDDIPSINEQFYKEHQGDNKESSL